MKKVKLGLYRHHKGKFYDVIGTAHHSETFEEFVIYRAKFTSKEFGKNALWARPKTMFMEKVEINGKKVPRFKYIGKKED